MPGRPCLALLLRQSLRLQSLAAAAAAAASWQDPAVKTVNQRILPPTWYYHSRLVSQYITSSTPLLLPFISLQFSSLTPGLRAAAAPLSPSRRLCLSRKKWKVGGRGVWKKSWLPLSEFESFLGEFERALG